MPVRVCTAGELEALLAKESLAEAAPLLLGANFTVSAALFPAVIVNGKVAPLKVNSELVVLAEDTTIFAPLALSVAVVVLFEPTVTLPKLVLVGETLNVPTPCEVPVPVKGTVKEGLEPLETTVMLPVATPLARGRKNTVNVIFCPADSVAGSVIPVRPNAEPLEFVDEIVTGDDPVFVNVSGNVTTLPTFADPKFMLPELATSFPLLLVVVPLEVPLAGRPQPFTASETVGLEALLVNEIVPNIRCATLGANLIVTAVLLPEARVKGNPGELIL